MAICDKMSAAAMLSKSKTPLGVSARRPGSPIFTCLEDRSRGAKLLITSVAKQEGLNPGKK